MKQYGIYLLLVVTILYACNNDEKIDLNHSIFTESEGTPNEFDRWLLSNYVYPYNIRVKYRLDDKETDVKYHLVPARYDKAVALMKIVKHVWIEAYDEVWGVEETRMHVPKLIHLIGNVAYTQSGMILGQAEGGLKVTLFRVNSIDPDKIDFQRLNKYYFETMHHEFTHILNQKKAYDVAFDRITESDYVGSSWYTISDNDALKKGFISPYSMDRPTEDFAELLSIFLTSTVNTWNRKLEMAGETGRPLIEKKFEIVNNYMNNAWHTDLYRLREIIQRRQGEIGYLDLKNL